MLDNSIVSLDVLVQVGEFFSSQKRSARGQTQLAPLQHPRALIAGGLLDQNVAILIEELLHSGSDLQRLTRRVGKSLHVVAKQPLPPFQTFAYVVGVFQNSWASFGIETGVKSEAQARRKCLKNSKGRIVKLYQHGRGRLLPKRQLTGRRNKERRMNIGKMTANKWQESKKERYQDRLAY